MVIVPFVLLTSPQYKMIYRIFTYLFGPFIRLLHDLGIRHRSDSNAAPDAECTGPEFASTESTWLLSQPEDNGQEFLTGHILPSHWYECISDADYERALAGDI